MKNRILSTILALSLVLSSFMLFSVSVAAEGEIVIPKVDNGITLDGNLTEADWTGACNIESAQFKMLWDENYLYVGYRAPYREDMWGGSTNYGGYVGGGEYCTFQVFDDGSATAYTNHITVTPNLGNVGSASEIVPGAPYLMSYHKQDGSGVYYPENVKINLNVAAGDYTLEAKIPWTEVNLDRSDLTAAQGDSFYMQIVRSDANVINPKALVVLGEAAEMPEVTAIPQGTVTVDGTLNDTEWFGAFYDENTQFKMLWDENFLYAGYVGTYNPDTWGASHDHGGFVGGGEYCLFQVFDSLAATAYTNHITVTPNLGNKTNANSASVLNAPNLMSYHKQDGSGAYYPDNAKITLDEENAIYTLEVKIPWTEINLDRSKLTAAQGDTFFMAIGGSGKAVFANTTEVVLGEAPERPAPTADYTASLTGPVMDVTAGDKVTFKVTVDNTFAAGKVVLNYDSTLLTPVAGEGIKVDEGTVTVVAYGADKTTLDVVFTANAAGTAKVTLTDAAFSTKEDAATEDLTEAAIETAEASVVITPAELSVTLPEIFEGNSAVANGSDYTFTAKDTANYTYGNVAATMGGATVEVIDNGDGTYTVKNVTGDLVITGERTANSYDVIINDEVAGEATYGEDYVFELPADVAVDGTTPGKTYTLTSVTIDKEAYTAYSVDGRKVTISGTAIVGEIVIVITETTVNPETYTVKANKDFGVGEFYGDATATKGVAYTFSFELLGGFTYDVTATVGGVAVDVIAPEQGDEYTIAAENVTGNIEITITATLDKSGVSVNEYVQLNGTSMWLVTIDVGALESNLTYTFDGNVMYMNGGKYVYLVVAKTLTVDEAKALVDVAAGAAKALTATNDVNGTGTIDANDAQFVYNMYNAMYADFETVSMEKFLLADVNADGVLNTADATAIVSAILS